MALAVSRTMVEEVPDDLAGPFSAAAMPSEKGHGTTLPLMTRGRVFNGLQKQVHGLPPVACHMDHAFTKQFAAHPMKRTPIGADNRCDAA